MIGSAEAIPLLYFSSPLDAAKSQALADLEGNLQRLPPLRKLLPELGELYELRFFHLNRMELRKLYQNTVNTFYNSLKNTAFFQTHH